MDYKKPEATVLGNAASVIQARKGNEPTDGIHMDQVHTKPD